MGPVLDPVQSDTVLPQRVDVVVIGGGIIGVCAALFLARRGVSVALCEKGAIGGEQSSRNWGWCRTIGRDLRELPLAMESLRLWGGMNALTEAETGFRPAGIAYLCDDAKEVAQYETWLGNAQDRCRDYQHTARILTGSALDPVTPSSTRIIPCHRIVGTNWLGGYSSELGLNAKEYLLDLERGQGRLF